ncbi:hypothetical protein ACQP1G_23455 [Nocardia sp. CA-107356]|uniref:hypothetical protein n=1 Tax=Nocardia sp. CA-107356 TaxID=3239972 RepID=UPI003D8C6055
MREHVTVIGDVIPDQRNSGVGGERQCAVYGFEVLICRIVRHRRDRRRDDVFTASCGGAAEIAGG